MTRCDRARRRVGTPRPPDRRSPTGGEAHALHRSRKAGPTRSSGASTHGRPDLVGPGAHRRLEDVRQSRQARLGHHHPVLQHLPAVQDRRQAGLVADPLLHPHRQYHHLAHRVLSASPRTSATAPATASCCGCSRRSCSSCSGSAATRTRTSGPESRRPPAEPAADRTGRRGRSAFAGPFRVRPPACYPSTRAAFPAGWSRAGSPISGLNYSGFRSRRSRARKGHHATLDHHARARHPRGGRG